MSLGESSADRLYCKTDDVPFDGKIPAASTARQDFPAFPAEDWPLNSGQGLRAFG